MNEAVKKRNIAIAVMCGLIMLGMVISYIIYRVTGDMNFLGFVFHSISDPIIRLVKIISGIIFVILAIIVISIILGIIKFMSK